jgi:hypothetical protein
VCCSAHVAAAAGKPACEASAGHGSGISSNGMCGILKCAKRDNVCSNHTQHTALRTLWSFAILLSPMTAVRCSSGRALCSRLQSASTCKDVQERPPQNGCVVEAVGPSVTQSVTGTGTKQKRGVTRLNGRSASSRSGHEGTHRGGFIHKHAHDRGTSSQVWQPPLCTRSACGRVCVTIEKYEFFCTKELKLSGEFNSEARASRVLSRV